VAPGFGVGLVQQLLTAERFHAIADVTRGAEEASGLPAGPELRRCTPARRRQRLGGALPARTARAARVLGQVRCCEQVPPRGGSAAPRAAASSAAVLAQNQGSRGPGLRIRAANCSGLAPCRQQGAGESVPSPGGGLGPIARMQAAAPGGPKALTAATSRGLAWVGDRGWER